MNLQQIVQILRSHKNELSRLFKVAQLGIFGSYAKGEQTNESDVDILVEFAEPIGLIQFSTTQIYISDLLGIKVDLVSKNNLHSRLRDQILKETVYL